MMTSPLAKLPTILTIGKSTIRFDQDDTFTLAFLNGMTVGHLTYMVYGKKAHLFDTDLILLITQQQTMWHTPLAFNAGFIVGYLSTQAQKQGAYTLTTDAFCEGYHEGLQAYCLVGRRNVLTLSELCCLLSWKHRGNDSAFNAGYVVGFVQGLTEGITAILAMIRGIK